MISFIHDYYMWVIIALTIALTVVSARLWTVEKQIKKERNPSGPSPVDWTQKEALQMIGSRLGQEYCRILRKKLPSDASAGFYFPFQFEIFFDHIFSGETNYSFEMNLKLVNPSARMSAASGLTEAVRQEIALCVDGSGEGVKIENTCWETADCTKVCIIVSRERKSYVEKEFSGRDWKDIQNSNHQNSVSSIDNSIRF